MRRADIDWSILRGSLIMLFVALLVSGSVLAGSYYFWGAMKTEFDRQHRQLLGVRRKYHTVDEEERIIETFLPRFEALENEGVIGREFRLNWIEQLREAAKTLKLPNLRYSIDTQKLYVPSFPVQDGKFKVFVSRMSLTLGLLHEEDLLRLFQVLDENVTGLYTISDCSLRRVRPLFGNSPAEANLNASCTLEWFTVKEEET